MTLAQDLQNPQYQAIARTLGIRSLDSQNDINQIKAHLAANPGAGTTAPAPARPAAAPATTTAARPAAATAARPAPAAAAGRPATAATGTGASTTNWWEEAYNGVINWSVNPNQLNPDRGAMQDALQVSAAEKGLNYDITSRLMARSTEDEKSLMQLSADLDRRNTLDLMTGEHDFKIAGMQEANRLSKDYLAAEGVETRLGYQTQGEEQRKGIVTSGEQDRLTVGAKGEQDRLGYQTQGDEARKTYSYQRDTDADRAVRMSRR